MRLDNLLVRVIGRVLSRVIGRSSLESLLAWIFDYLGISPLNFAYNRMGILNYKSEVESGESHFIQATLKTLLPIDKECFVFVDAGANYGNYTKLLLEYHPKAIVHAFEPNPTVFKSLCDRFDRNSNVQLNNFGLSSLEGKSKLNTYKENIGSAHASLHKGIFENFHVASEIVEIDINLTTLDSYTYYNRIETIDFLKVDTEGHELDVFKGSRKLFQDGRVSVVQFEFGECHVFSRNFLRDFHEILIGFDLYRLTSFGMTKISPYNVGDEIFRFQNIIGVYKNIRVL